MVRHYRFAGVEISVSMPENRFFIDEYRLAPFAVDQVTNPYEFVFTIEDQLEAPIGECLTIQPSMRVYQEGQYRIRYFGSVQNSQDGAYIAIKNQGCKNQVQLLSEKFPNRVGTKTVLNAIEAEHLVVQNGGVILHCSYIDWNGAAILFTAPSETGKSTQAELWKQFRGAEIINGDRAAVRLVDGNCMAEGIPFSGSSKECLNRSLPIRAIVYLGKEEENQIRRLTGYEAFSKVWEGIAVNVWDSEDTGLAAGIVEEIVKRVPVFYLKCRPDESAVEALKCALMEFYDGHDFADRKDKTLSCSGDVTIERTGE